MIEWVGGWVRRWVGGCVRACVYVGAWVLRDLPVLHNIPFRTSGHQLKFRALHVVGQVGLVEHLYNVHLEAIVGPRAKLQLTHLIVKWKVCDVDVTATSQDCGRIPGTLPVRTQYDSCLEHVQCSAGKNLLVGTGRRESITKN